MPQVECACLSQIPLSDAARQILVHDSLYVPLEHLQAERQLPARPVFAQPEESGRRSPYSCGICSACNLACRCRSRCMCTCAACSTMRVHICWGCLTASSASARPPRAAAAADEQCCHHASLPGGLHLQPASQPSTLALSADSVSTDELRWLIKLQKRLRSERCAMYLHTLHYLSQKHYSPLPVVGHIRLLLATVHALAGEDIGKLLRLLTTRS